MKGQVPHAIEQWRRALEIEPRNADLRYNLGIALLKQGRPQEAAQQWKLSLRDDPSYEKARRELLKLGQVPPTS